MLGQEDTIPELAAVHKEFFDKLKAAKTRMQLDLAIAAYKRGLDDLVARGIIIESHWRTLRLAIPMHADYAWAKKAGEVGTPAEVRAGVAEKTTSDWAMERGYVKEAAGKPGILDILKHLPEALKEAIGERIEEIAGIEKGIIPKWGWGLLVLGSLGIAALFAAGYALRGIGSE